MITTNKFKTLYTDKKYQLRGLLQKDAIRLRLIRHSGGKTICCYCATVRSVKELGGQARSWAQNLEDVMSLLEKGNGRHVYIDETEGNGNPAILIVQINQKNMYSVLGKIYLQKQQISPSKPKISKQKTQQFLDSLQSGLKNTKLTNFESIKTMLGLIHGCLREVVNNSNAIGNNSMLDQSKRILEDKGYVGANNQVLKDVKRIKQDMKNNYYLFEQFKDGIHQNANMIDKTRKQLKILAQKMDTKYNESSYQKSKSSAKQKQIVTNSSLKAQTAYYQQLIQKQKTERITAEHKLKSQLSEIQKKLQRLSEKKINSVPNSNGLQPAHQLELSQRLTRCEQKLFQTFQEIDKMQQRLGHLPNQKQSVIRMRMGKDMQMGRMLEQSAVAGVGKDASGFVDKDCLHFRDGRFYLRDNMIVNDNASFCFIFGKRRVQGKYSFSLKFSRIGKCVFVGLADSSYKGDNQVRGKNRIIYANDGDSHDGNKWGKEGSGFKEGQTIQINVNINKGYIEWKVDGVVRQYLNCEFLKNPSIYWVPFIWLDKQKDAFKILSF